MAQIKRLRKDNPFRTLVLSFMEKNSLNTTQAAKLFNVYPASVSRIINGYNIPLMTGFCHYISKMDLSGRELVNFMKEMSEYHEKYKSKTE